MMRVPRFSDEQLSQMLGLGPQPLSPEEQKRADELAAQLLAGTVDWSEWDEFEGAR